MSIYNKLRVAVIGATGYTGLDLILILSNHPKVLIKNLCATKNLGKKISFFDNRIKKNLPKISSINEIDWHSIIKIISPTDKRKFFRFSKTRGVYFFISFISKTIPFLDDCFTRL